MGNTEVNSNASNIFQNLKKVWATNNKFNIDIMFVGKGASELNSTTNMGPGITLFSGKDVTPYVIDVQIPDLANETIEEWVVNEFRVAMGRNSIEQVQVKFRDERGFPIYNALKNFIRKSTEFFPESIYWDIKVKQAMDTSIQTYAGKGQEVFSTSTAVLTSLSGLTFIQADGEVAEFSATWKIGTVTGSVIKSR